MSLEVLHFSDPGCPWAYSAHPALAVLRWRYGDQLQWRLVAIGLTEDAAQYVARGYTPAGSAKGYRAFRRYGMPFATEPRPRIAATSLACRAIVATRLLAPEREWAAFRALQFGWFTTTLVLDEHEDVALVLAGVPGLDAERVMGRVEDAEVREAYEADRALARTAAGSPTEFQGKAANSDGLVRYTAPSLVFRDGERTLEAGGFQPVEAYDVLVANLDPGLDRRPPPDGPLPALEAMADGLTTQEVAAVLAVGNDAPDRAAAEEGLIDLAGEGRVERVALGDDALWRVRATG